MTAIDVKFNDTNGSVASNVISDGTNIYALRAEWVEDNIKQRLVIWDSEWNVINEIPLSLLDENKITYVYSPDTLHIVGDTLYLIGEQSVYNDTHQNGFQLFYTMEMNLKNKQITKNNITDIIEEDCRILI